MHDDFEIVNGAAHGTTVLLRVRGRIDAKSAPHLLRRCTAVRNAGQNLVLNLSEVSFIASSGVGALLALVEQFRETRSKMRLVALSAAVDSVIRLLNLDQFLAIDTTEDAALSAIETQ